MESSRVISQEANNQLVAALESYATQSRTSNKYLVIKTSDGTGYTTVAKANWLVLKILSVLHFFNLYNGVFCNASQAEKTTLVRDIIAILNTCDSQPDRNRIIQAASPFLGKLWDALDAELQNELETAMTANSPRITPEKTFTTKEDYLKLLDSIGYASLLWGDRLATFLSEQGPFTQSQNGQLSPSETLQFNEAVMSFFNTLPGAHLLEFVSVRRPLDCNEINRIYNIIGRENTVTIKIFNDINPYLKRNNYFDLNNKYERMQFEEFREHLCQKAEMEEGFVVPIDATSEVSSKFLRKELHIFNEIAQQRELERSHV
jgi:hypothetical protein